MKIDKNNKTPLYGPNETPQKLRQFYAQTPPSTPTYRERYDNIKWNSQKENANEQRKDIDGHSK